MNLDPTMNVVVFQLNGDQEPAIADAPTQADDAVRQAWWKIIRERRPKARDVTVLHSEWEPSEADKQFIQRAFPNLQQVRHNFPRPDPEGWEEAFEQARQVMQQHFEDNREEYEAAAQKAQADALKAQGTQLLNDMPQMRRDGVLLPILRSFSVEGMFGPEQELIPDKLWVRLARVAMTPRGTIGQSHLTQADLENTTFDELLEQACDNLREGLGGKLGQDDGRGNLLHMEREGHQGASALVLPDFHEWVSGILGTDLLIVGLACEDHLNITGADSGWLEEIVEMVACHDHDSGVSRYVLLVDGSGMRVIGEFEAPDPDGWRRALPQIREAIDEYRRNAAEQRRHAPVNVLTPMLHSAVSPPPSTPSYPVVPGRLHVLLARSTSTPEGTIALDYMTDEDLDANSFDNRLLEAYTGLVEVMKERHTGIEIGGSPRTLVTFTAPEGYLMASLVGLPDYFYTSLSGTLETDRFFAGFTNHDRLYVAAADCGLEGFKAMTRFSEPSAPGLAATILLFEPERIQIVAEQFAR